MIQYLRIKATYLAPPDAADPGEYSIVFDALVEDGRIVPQQYFGLAARQYQGSTSRWPIVLRQETKGSAKWIFDYGDFGESCENPPDETNILERTIALGGYFAVGPKDDAATYAITQLSELK